jgi:hemolysin activation/secretion protein
VATALGVWALAGAARAATPVVERPDPPLRPPPSAGTVRYELRLPAKPAPLKGVHIDGDKTTVPADVLRLIGQPITPQLVTRIESRINRALAAEGRQVTTVRYESAADDGGVLTFGARSFVVGRLTIKGGTAADKTAVGARLGLRAGQAVDPAALAFDLENLNRYPFRQVDVKVGPAPGLSDVTVEVTPTRPWTAYWGVRYSGSPRLISRRLYAGGSVGGLLGRDSVVSVDVTESPDYLVRSRRHPRMADASVTYTLPVGRRGLIEAGIELTGMTFPAPPDTYWLVENDATLGYRYFLTGPATGRGQSDVRIGLDLRHERTIDYQNETVVFNAAADLNELYLGYHVSQSRPAWQNDIDLSLRLSPAVDMPGTRAAHYADYTGGRMISARYSYLTLAADETVGPATGAQWRTQVSAMLASGPIPYWDQLILGGQRNVRGYFLPDGSYDDAVIWRNEFRFGKGPFTAIAPFVLADIGYGRDAQTKDSETLASVGLGVSLKLSKAVTLVSDIAYTLSPGQRTAARTAVFEANLKTSY